MRPASFGTGKVIVEKRYHNAEPNDSAEKRRHIVDNPPARGIMKSDQHSRSGRRVRPRRDDSLQRGEVQ